MYNDPFVVAVTYLVDRIRCRVSSASDGDPESGGLSLEWIVIASLLTIAAAAVGLFISTKITAWEGNVKTP
jgi:hypothetical protein